MAKSKKKIVKKKAQAKKKPVSEAIKKVTSSTTHFSLLPLGDRIILEEVKDVQEKTASGIYLPDSAQGKETKKGRVVAVGAGRYEDGDLIPMSVKVGDTVLYGWGDKVKVDGTEYVIVRESEVTAIVQ